MARMMAMALRLEGSQPHLYDDGRPTLEAMLERSYAAAVLYIPFQVRDLMEAIHEATQPS